MARILSKQIEVVLNEEEWAAIVELIELIGKDTDGVAGDPRYDVWDAADDVRIEVDEAERKANKK